MSKNLNEYLRQLDASSAKSLQPGVLSGSRKIPADFRSGSEKPSDMDTNPAKKMKISTDSRAGIVSSTNEEKMELIRLKGHSKLLETRIAVLERELEENHTMSERERNGHELTKNTLDARISSLEREISYIIERERQAQDRASNAEKLLFEERASSDAKFRKFTEDRRLAELEASEQYDRLRSENQTLHANYMEERRQVSELRHDCSQARNELGMLKRHNLDLTEQLKVATDQIVVLRDINQQLQDDLKRFREDCAVAMVMRDELSSLKALKQENGVLKKQVERYKATSENTLLLKEQNMAFEERVARLQHIQEQLANENNELKSVISKSAQSSGQHVSYDDLDDLSRHCVDLRNENSALCQEIQRLNDELQEKANLVTQYEQEWEHRVTDMELTLSTKDDLLQTQDTKCNELEALIAEKDADLVELQNRLSVALDENVGYHNRLYVSKSEEECQTEDIIMETAGVDELKKALEEKDARIDYLESRYALKLDYNPAITCIIHMDENPLAIAQREHSERLKIIESENHELRLRLEEYARLTQNTDGISGENIHQDVTTIVNLRLKIEELDIERKDLLEKSRKLEEEKSKQMERMKEVHQNLTREYREMCALLTGFQLKMKDGGIYVVQSIYEKDKEDYFLIQRGEDNEINLLQNQYTPRWMDFVETYLMTDHSIPAFLAAVTLSLYEKDKDTGHVHASFGGASTSSST